MGSSNIIILAILICSCLTFASAGSTTWTYAGAGGTGENMWSTISGSSCAGTAQSPINIVTMATREIRLPPFDFTSYYYAKKATLTNNGHALEVDIADDASGRHYDLTGGGLNGIYRATQFHFHFGSDGRRGSEHTVNGRRFPAEMHIVHYNTAYGSSAQAMYFPRGLAVLGFFLQEGNHNPDLDIILNHVGKVIQPDTSYELPRVTLANILPSTLSTGAFWRYEGSLTTPLCNEVVTWSVFQDTIDISRAQLNILRNLMSNAMDRRHHQMPMANNYRSIQNLNGRPVYSVINGSDRDYSRNRDRDHSRNRDRDNSRNRDRGHSRERDRNGRNRFYGKRDY